MSVPRAIGTLGLIPLLAIALSMPLALGWPPEVHQVGLVAVAVLALLYPGFVGMVAARSREPWLVVVAGAVLFTLPIVVSIVLTRIIWAIEGRETFWPDPGVPLVLAFVALAALLGGRVATRLVQEGRVVVALAAGGLVEAAILAIPAYVGVLLV